MKVASVGFPPQFTASFTKLFPFLDPIIYVIIQRGLLSLVSFTNFVGLLNLMNFLRLRFLFPLERECFNLEEITRQHCTQKHDWISMRWRETIHQSPPSPLTSDLLSKILVNCSQLPSVSVKWKVPLLICLKSYSSWVS